jgi:hypothetical protein
MVGGLLAAAGHSVGDCGGMRPIIPAAERGCTLPGDPAGKEEGGGGKVQ